MEPEDRFRVASWMKTQNVHAGTEIAAEGDLGYTFFVLADGVVRVTADGREIRTIGRGDFFGEMALLGAGQRKGTVTATTDATVLILYRNDFERMQHEHPDIAAELESAMQARLADVESA